MILATIAAACAIAGAGTFTAPDNHCTPGASAHLTRAQACHTRDRPTLPAAERRRILTDYGVPGWTGRDGELDHRIPFFLGGTTDHRNIWPERGRIPNPKDRLESYIWRRVCVRHTMRPRTARRLFRQDWRTTYRRYFP
jgi:hypothetical protein